LKGFGCSGSPLIEIAGSLKPLDEHPGEAHNEVMAEIMVFRALRANAGCIKGNGARDLQSSGVP